jgi:hypothetical protein
MEDYYCDTIEQIRKMNPSIFDLDPLEAGQEIRFSWVPVPADSPTSGEAALTSVKNWKMRYHL